MLFVRRFLYCKRFVPNFAKKIMLVYPNAAMTFYSLKFTCKLLILLLLYSPLASGQDTVMVFNDTLVANDTVKPSVWKNLKYDGLNMFRGVVHAYSQPAHWKKKDFMILGGVAAGTAILMLTDEDTSPYFINQAAGTPQLIKDVGWYFGSPQNNYGITGGIYLYGLFTHNEKIRKTGVLLISSASAAGIIQTFSKNIVGRARPMRGEGAASFKPLSKEGGYHSFPSGHTILSFTTAYAIGKQFKNPWARYGIYAFGMVSPVSRLWEGAHWASDVGLSLALSVAIVESIDNYLNREKKYNLDTQPKISWNLNFTGNTIGFTGTF